MAYVDLSSIRTSLCNTPETSDLTNIKEHIALGFDLKGIAKNALFRD